ncbi:MAG: hypothetical protein NUV57_01270 [archaeon]|nr:hypothetical protein [archaeon]
MKKFLLPVFIIGLIILSGCTQSNNSDNTKVELYKSASCGCCSGYAAEMSGKNFNVEKINTENMSNIKTQYNIPSNMQSCHTSIIEGYFVEGHVPIEAVNKLLEERPDIDGIALPRMPAGSLGMPGVKQGKFIIYALKNGNATVFMEI